VLWANKRAEEPHLVHSINVDLTSVMDRQICPRNGNTERVKQPNREIDCLVAGHLSRAICFHDDEPSAERAWRKLAGQAHHQRAPCPPHALESHHRSVSDHLHLPSRMLDNGSHTPGASVQTTAVSTKCEHNGVTYTAV
jgi:hypothetical protein